MLIIYALLFIYLFLPVVGTLMLLATEQEFFVRVDWSFFYANLLFATVIFVFVALFVRGYNANISLARICRPKRTMTRILVLMIAVSFFVFALTGYDFLFNGVDRGRLRVGMGYFGPLYSWLLVYFIPILIALAYICLQNDEYKLTSKFTCILILSFFCAICTGYKSAVVTILFPVLTLYFCKKRNMLHLIKYGFLCLTCLVGTTSLVRNIGFEEALIFVKYRLLSMTGAGTMAVAQEFPDGAGLHESIKLLYGLLGNRFSVMLAGEDFSSVAVMKMNLARYISYLTYGDVEAVMSGRVNLTVNFFGEAIYFMGYRSGLYIVYAIVTATVLVVLFRLFKKNIKTSALSGLLILSYIYSVVFASLNSGGLTSLFAPTVLVYMIMSYIFLVLIIKARF